MKLFFFLFFSYARKTQNENMDFTALYTKFIKIENRKNEIANQKNQGGIMNNVIYLAAGHAVIDGYNITYQDIKVARDIQGDMMDVDLEPYDIIIATPPCNYYSSANWRRDTSEYSQKTKHLLPEIIRKLEKIEKPYIVENIRNRGLMKDVFPLATHVIFHGRHTYFTNVWFDPSDVPQKKDDIQNKSKKVRQGGFNVNMVIEHWLKNIGEML